MEDLDCFWVIDDIMIRIFSFLIKDVVFISLLWMYFKDERQKNEDRRQIRQISRKTEDIISENGFTEITSVTVAFVCTCKDVFKICVIFVAFEVVRFVLRFVLFLLRLRS